MLLGSTHTPAICNFPDNVFRKHNRYTPGTCVAQENSSGICRLPFSNTFQELILSRRGGSVAGPA